MSKPHKWEAHELPPIGSGFGGEYPRPAQKCSRCGLVRRMARAFWNGEEVFAWNDGGTVFLSNREPPCEPAASEQEATR